MRSDSLVRACDEFIERDDAGDLLRRLLYSQLGITAPMSNAQIGIALDEVCDGIRDRANELADPAAVAAERAEHAGEYQEGARAT